jgi:hypothetical protein
MRRRTRRDQRGVSLILVLVTLVIFGLIVPVLGQFGSTNGVSGYVLKGNRFDRYAADAGMQAALNWAQGQRQAGRQGTGCPKITTGNLNDNAGTNADRTVTVTCAGYDDNGLPRATVAMPQFALLALGTGRAITLSGGGNVRTDGAWWSNGSIDPGDVSVDATADYVGAHDGCAGINASPCDPTRGASQVDPGYAGPIPSTITVDRPQSDACAVVDRGTRTVTIPSGLHWQRKFFDDLGDGKCGSLTLTLADGPHIFDFNYFGGGRSDWRLIPDGSSHARVQVVSAAKVGGTCREAAAPVLMAGTFTMEVGNGATVDLCGAGGGGQRLSLGQVGTEGSDAQFRDSAVQSPTSWTFNRLRGAFDNFTPNPPNSPPVPVTTLRNVDCDPNDNCGGGFVQGRLHGDRAEGQIVMQVPDPVTTTLGAKIRSIHVRITHREDGAADVDQSHVFISNGLPGSFQSECNSDDSASDLRIRNSWDSDDYVCDLRGVESPYFPTGNLEITYDVQLKNQDNGSNTPDRSAVVGIDAVLVQANYANATARRSVPSGDLLTVDPNGAMHAVGSVYLPHGDVTLKLGSSPSTTFARGLVVRTVAVQNPPPQENFTPFSLPGGGNYTDRLTTFRAFLGDDPNTDTDTPVLTARVRFCDVHPEHGTPTAPCIGDLGGPAKILAWDPTR